MRGAAWATPTVIVTASAPAFAASSPCIPVNLPVNASTPLEWDSGWTETLDASQFVNGTGTLAGAPQAFRGSGGSACVNGNSVTQTSTEVTNAKVGQRDPKTNSASFSYSRAVCFAAGTYELTYFANAYQGNPVTAYMKPSITGPSGTLATTAAGSLSKDVTSYGFINPTTGTGPNPAYTKANLERTQFGFRFVVAANGTFTFRFVWTFGAISTDAANTGQLERTGNSCNPTYANDIAVEAPIVKRIS